MQGVIDFLLSDKKEAEHLRNEFIFKIVPCLNPDGVIFGNYRCSLLGVDLNRRWITPSRVLHPTIYCTKNLIKHLHERYRVALYCDFHGHSRKMNVFMYGCVCFASEVFSHRNNSLIRVFPYLMSQRSKIFAFPECKFAIEKEKEATARVVVFKELGVLNSYTLEATFFGSDLPEAMAAAAAAAPKKKNAPKDKKEKLLIDDEVLRESGRDFSLTVCQMLQSKVLRRKFLISPLGGPAPPPAIQQATRSSSKCAT